jgi:hypothetical protein
LGLVAKFFIMSQYLKRIEVQHDHSIGRAGVKPLVVDVPVFSGDAAPEPLHIGRCKYLIFIELLDDLDRCEVLDLAVEPLSLIESKDDPVYDLEGLGLGGLLRA